ncbi:unnamed protein product [Camellia sinensis]
MPLPLTVVTKLENRAGAEIVIREYRSTAPEGQYGDTITLASNQDREISATKINRRCVESLRSSVLKIFVGGDDTGRILKPCDLVDYSRILFKHENGNLLIIGLRDTSPCPMHRINGLRFLMGRNNYQDMAEEEIA